MVAPDPPSKRVIEQHLHGGEIAGMAGAIDLDDQPRHPREVAGAFLDELDARQFRERNRIGEPTRRLPVRD